MISGILGLEGVSCVGKTTIARRIAEARRGAPVLVVDDYPQFAGRPNYAGSPVPTSVEAAKSNLRTMFRLERRRKQSVEGAVDGSLIILDRTFYTLVAHLYAVGKLGGHDWLGPLASETRRNWEDLTVPDRLVLMSEPYEVRSERASRRLDTPSLFYGREYSTHFEFAISKLRTIIQPELTIEPVEWIQQSIQQGAFR